MTMEAIERVTQLEQKTRADKAEAEARVRHALAEAEREGEALLQKTRSDAAEKGKALLRQAEARAAQTAAEIAGNAERECDALREKAGARLDEAAEYIVGRVVKS
ncbi:MAG: hypothetical protein K6G54_06595 [Oscillospiraceae bacterium]|nr:hypothetical protein [Oscillospiraceae bacterium]